MDYLTKAASSSQALHAVATVAAVYGLSKVSGLSYVNSALLLVGGGALYHFRNKESTAQILASLEADAGLTEAKETCAEPCILTKGPKPKLSRY